ncbi:MAG: vWA domain-containing protein [Spirosomataceae bacterium]
MNNSVQRVFALLILSFVLTFFTFSCDPKDVTPQNVTFRIFLDFWNTTGRTPEIRFDEQQTSREIKIDFSKTFGGFPEGTSFTKVIIDNFRIVDLNSNNYVIDNIKAYEFRPELQDFKEDVEFTMSFTQSDDIAVMLVLDRSESLGDDFQNVKTYASNFVEKVFTDRGASVEMGIVDFADNINVLPLSKDKNRVKSYVSNLSKGKFTTLYEAVDRGIDELRKSQAQSRVLIIFTDGTDNNSGPTFTPDFLLNKMRNDQNTAKITSFAIGLEGKGGVDKPVLTKLSSNGGIAEFPTNAAQLSTVFDKFSKVISNVYNLTYLRNQQVVPRNAPKKLRFDIITTKQ